jgi:DHA2 family multidrug resistance protein
MALKAVDGIVRREAYVMAYNDGFFLVAAVLFGCIGVLWFSDKVKAPGGAVAAARTNKYRRSAIAGTTRILIKL